MTITKDAFVKAARAKRRALARETAVRRRLYEEPTDFQRLCVMKGLPAPIREHAFAAPARRWRFDYCWPDGKLFLEVDGGVWTNGRHNRGSGWLKDTEKLNCAAALGWRHLRCTPDTLHDLALIETIRQALTLTERLP